ncbi:MAG: T9SS type A sorting domain-containing protein [Bacteroidota bacterium]|nr:T9SS type A sorting domain-containing protein [Bacteroidota bacterium]
MLRLLTVPIALIGFIMMFILNITNNEDFKKEVPKKSKSGRSGALEALDFWTQSRAYPDNDIPPDKYFKAFQSSKLQIQELKKSLSGGSIWDPIGPLNLQGRSKSVAINPLNPNTVYVGTASGGLFRSYTGGLASDWEQVRLGHPALGISAIVIHPTDTNIIYLGTGEVYKSLNSTGGLVQRTTRGSYGIGILKTTNGGLTWTKSLDWSYDQRTGIQALRMNPRNPNTLWTATTEGIYKTTNAGASWELNESFPMVMDIVIHYNDTNKILVSIGNFSSSVTFRTTDGGNNWLNSPLSGYTGKTILDVYRANPDVVFASAADSTTGVGALYRSTNFGESWIKLKDYFNTGQLLGVQGWYSHFVAVHPNDSSIIIHNGVRRSKSTDGGANFSSVGSGYPDNHSFAIHPTNPNLIYVVNDDGVYRSTDFGSTYVNVGFGMQSGQIYGGFSCSATDSLLALGQSQDHIPGYRYLGSNIWDHGSAVDEVGWTAIDQTNDNIMYAGYRFGQAIYKSTNRGVSFTWAGSFAAGAWNSPFVVSKSHPNILYFGTYKVYKTINYAGSWTATNSNTNIDVNPALSMAMSSTNPDTVYIGTAPIAAVAHVYRTTNGGTSWTNITGTLPNRYPIDMAVDPQDSRIVYVAFGGFGSGHLYKSTDAGTSWTDMTGTLPDVPTTAIVVDPLHPNVVYVGNDIGVYVSTNGGTTWSGFSEGLPDAVIAADLTISPSNCVLRVATHGNGVWERKMLYELPADYFDYKLAVLNSPIDGSQHTLGDLIAPIRITLRNLSSQPRSDSFNVKYRILFQNSEVFSTTKRVAPLAIGESRQITFDGSFAPIKDSVYILQAILLASDYNPSNDTLNGSMTIVLPSTVSYWTVDKMYSPYTEIVGGSPGPSGDDVQMNISLPFTFIYDNYTYEKAQISTNGWLELGMGEIGTIRGLSSAGQLGMYFKYVLGSNEKPTKVLAPWNTDLDTRNTEGVISYTTQGSAPNRIFIVQWKHMPYYDGGTTLHLNFQIKLYETTNIAEYCYGTVEAGTFSGSGASMGLKDYVGGDFRYYDISQGGTGYASNVKTDLTPLTNWPGADSSYRINTDTKSITVSLMTGWNLVSLPVTRNNRSINKVFPSAFNGYAFEYSGSYKPVDSLEYGKGFWIKLPAAIDRLIPGKELPQVSVNVSAGWNMIGSVDHEVSAPSGENIVGSVFGYNGSGYEPVTMLIPGGGYWVKARTTHTIILGSQSVPKEAANVINSSNSITITNKLNKKQTLYFTEAEDGYINIEEYELPPMPPGELFDARFRSQRMLELYSRKLREDLVYPIQMQSPVYPLTISYKIKNSGDKNFFLEEMASNENVASHQLSGEGKIIIMKGDEQTLRLKVTGGKQIPTQFALMQNYPNPFNPTTTIAFDVPTKSNVSLIVYDILGKEVMRLVEGEYEPGSHTIEADLSSLASGVYLYRLNANNFVSVKKMVFAR